MAGDAGNSVVKIWDLGPTGDAEWANLPAPGASRGGVHAGRTAPGDEPLGPRDVSAVTIWDLQTGRDLRTIGPATDYFWFQSFDVSPDGTSIALGGGSKPDGCPAVRQR